ncbi:serine-tRNA ligase [Suillus weaverae]|nr:serine-tRNA ligase [Suillus weaverae]
MHLKLTNDYTYRVFNDGDGAGNDKTRAVERRNSFADVDDEPMDFEANGLSKQLNAVQKEIAAKKKAKQPADDLVAAKVGAKQKETREFEVEMRKKASTVGNLVAKDVPVSLTEKTDIMPHHEVLLRLDAMDLDRGAKVAGHRGYFLANDGVDLNQALITYALDFLRKNGYKKAQPPFLVNKDVMAKTAQLDQFDEELYKIQKTQLPIYYAGYSTCFRKEADSAGRHMWGIFRVHQFEKDEQFVITTPEESWNAFDTMLGNSEAFYQSLGLSYRVVAILEAWFPFRGACKELVSCSNCMDYQSRRLENRCGLKAKDQQRKVYVHMLNGSMCATERALCYLVENYQTPGLIIPEVLRPYMQGRDFVPWVKELPKNLQRKQI